MNCCTHTHTHTRLPAPAPMSLVPPPPLRAPSARAAWHGSGVPFVGACFPSLLDHFSFLPRARRHSPPQPTCPSSPTAPLCDTHRITCPTLCLLRLAALSAPRLSVVLVDCTQ
jgi:hypothetical protein